MNVLTNPVHLQSIEPGCLDSDGDGYSNQGDPFPNDDTQWANRDGDSQDCGGDNQSGNNPDIFPDDPTQCKDTDGDGYGDNAAGNNGDAFKFDPTQWSDFDGDGFGDNNGTGSINGDICPTQAGNSANPISRGCRIAMVMDLLTVMRFHKTHCNGLTVTEMVTETK